MYIRYVSYSVDVDGPSLRDFQSVNTILSQCKSNYNLPETDFSVHGFDTVDATDWDHDPVYWLGTITAHNWTNMYHQNALVKAE